MKLEEIYRPIRKELSETERLIKQSVERGGNASVLKMSNYLHRSRGKRLRPALVVLSAKAVTGNERAALSRQVIEIASAVELSHLASLIHDDVVDHSSLRRNLPTVNAKWGEETSIILGDYLYSVAFNLISGCKNTDILACVSQATRLMCEGELVQICERDNVHLLKDTYITIIKNKTANLFAASCRAGALAVGSTKSACRMLDDYGMNVGIAFQIVDDSLDLMGDAQALGKDPGADFKMGESTLPILNLLSIKKNRKKIKALIAQNNNSEAFRQIRRTFVHSGALEQTKQDVVFYITKAKASLKGLEDSSSKRSLYALADYVAEKMKI